MGGLVLPPHLCVCVNYFLHTHPLTITQSRSQLFVPTHPCHKAPQCHLCVRMNPASNPNRRFHRLRQLEEGFVRPVVQQIFHGNSAAANAAWDAFDRSVGVALDPIIQYTNERWESPQPLFGALSGIGAAAGLIQEFSGSSSSRPESDRPRKRLRGNDWLKLSPPGSSPQFSNSPAQTSSSTFPLSLYSQGLRKGDRLTKSLKWFRTRLLLRSRFKKRTRGFRARSSARSASRRVDRLQRYTRKLQRTWRTSEFKYRLRQLAKAKRLLWKARRRARKYGR